MDSARVTHGNNFTVLIIRNKEGYDTFPDYGVMQPIVPECLSKL